MISTGAYSKKYQAVERERMRELKDKERKNGRERAYILSLQTAQRQKAIEDKKRAMIIAEEERRKKALEDRRQSQKQATERFRLAISRVRSAPKSSLVIGRNIREAKITSSRCTHIHQTPVKFTSGFQVRNNNNGGSTEERLAIGKEVELTPETGYSQSVAAWRKTPSMDDVLDQIQGNSLSDGTMNEDGMHVHKSTITNINRNKSASDTTLTDVNRPIHMQLTQDNDSGRIKDYEDKIFHHVNKIPYTDQEDAPCDLTVVSPDLHEEDNPSIPDSLNTSIDEMIPSRSNSPAKPFRESGGSTTETLFKKLSHSEEKQAFKGEIEQPVFCCGDGDTSSIDSLEHLNITSSEIQPPISNSSRLIVGILKKTNPSKQNNSTKLNFVHRKISFDNSCQLGQKSSSKSQRRVHFSDQIETNEQESQITDDITNSVQIELWKRVFPNEFSSQLVPNSAFTPKMRCSLSSNASTPQGNVRVIRKPLASTTDVAVHIPAAAQEDPPFQDQNGETNSDNLSVENEDNSIDGINDQCRSLQKTPTDTEINDMWDQIRQCLQDSRKVSVAPRVFNFKPPTENGRRTLTYNYGSTNAGIEVPTYGNVRSNSSSVQSNGLNHSPHKQLAYRQPNRSRLLKQYNELQSLPKTTRVLPVRQQPFKNHSQHSELNDRYKAVTPTTALSLEEKQLVQSIERINQKLKDHVGASSQHNNPQPATQYYHPVPPSTPPKRNPHPSIGRTRILNDTSKNRIHQGTSFRTK